MAFEILRDSREAVDRERGYSLRDLGGRSDGVVNFKLQGPDGTVMFSATQRYRPFTGDEERLYPDAIHKVVGVWEPRNILRDSPLWPIICEALTAHKFALGEPASVPFEVQ
ncbi:hypothetical protein ACFOMD_02160 [Sphingoaurantiacus capsulatus]|uniref:Uncharacterized protein n=1 Tax=Sphingoaurantiacus capsulatus TaxID=1771310 RepID=A0ABV7X6A5_9SPHN